MKERLEFQDGGSSKFWEIETEGARVTVTFGKLGSAGQTKVKDLPSPAEAEASAATQLAEKKKKGYRSVGAEAAGGAAAAPDDALARLPAALAAMVGTDCFMSREGEELGVVVFDWDAIELPARQQFLSDLFGDSEQGDFAELLSFEPDVRWISTRCVPFAFENVVSGSHSFHGVGPPQFDRLLLIDSTGAVHGIEVDGTAVGTRPEPAAKSWTALKLKVRPPPQSPVALPAFKPTRRVRMLGCLGEFRAPSRNTPLVHSMMTSADAARAVFIVRGGPEDPARLYDVASGTLLRSFGPSWSGVAISPDGNTVVTAFGAWTEGMPRTIVAYAAEGGAELWRTEAHRGGMYNHVHMAVSPDGATLVTSSEGSSPTLRAYDLKTGAERWSARLGAPDVRAEALAFSPDGSALAAGCSDSTLQIWDVAAGTCTHRVAHKETPVGLAWFADGSRLVSNSSHLAAIWVPGQPQPEKVLAEYEGGRLGGAVVVSSDGYIATRVDSTKIDLWALQGSQLERLDLKKKIGVGTLAACAGGLLVGTAADCALRFAVSL